MKKKSNISLAKEIIKREIVALNRTLNQIDSNFNKACEVLSNVSGKVITIGLGKSGYIAMKMSGTLSSTGTPSIFIHAAEALHGDMGAIKNNDVIIIYSKSGETNEIIKLLPLLKILKCPIISITGDCTSSLAKYSDISIDASVTREACPNNLAPTTSTTAQLVIGDALAICLSELKGFKESDFAKFHPGGSLGKKLHLKVKDLVTKNLKPQVNYNETFKNIIDEISKKMLGATAVLKNKKVIGIITDGDLRRFFSKNINLNRITAVDLMSKSPKKTNSDILAFEAFKIMKKNKITQLIVEDNNNYTGIIHIHNIIKEGIS